MVSNKKISKIAALQWLMFALPVFDRPAPVDPSKAEFPHAMPTKVVFDSTGRQYR